MQANTFSNFFDGLDDLKEQIREAEVQPESEVSTADVSDSDSDSDS